MNDIKLNCKYIFSNQLGSDSHIWTCIGGQGAVHLHISIYHGILEDKEPIEPSAGIEYHHKNPPYNIHDAPSQNHCWILESPCWHDGSSLYASEVFVPLWKNDPHDHKRMFEKLEREYSSRFMKEDSEEE